MWTIYPHLHLSTDQRRKLIAHWQQRMEAVVNSYYRSRDFDEFLKRSHLVRERLNELRGGIAHEAKIVKVEFVKNPLTADDPGVKTAP